jgi:GNAT superfamily N-acetyltransferase
MLSGKQSNDGREDNEDTGCPCPGEQPRSLSEAIAQALANPFPLRGDLAEPLSADSAPGNPWEWAVFSNCAPGKSARATTRALRKAVRAARELDRLTYVDNRFVTDHDLLAKSGPWPYTGGSWNDDVEYKQDGYFSAEQRFRLVVCSQRGPVGFCTVSTSVTNFSGSDVPDLLVDIRTAFIDPAYRNRGLSRMLAESAAVVALELIRELQARLIASGVRGTFDVVLPVQGEIISEGGLRFLNEVGKWLEWLMEDEPLVGENGEAVLRVKRVEVYDVA